GDATGMPGTAEQRFAGRRVLGIEKRIASLELERARRPSQLHLHARGPAFGDVAVRVDGHPRRVADRARLDEPVERVVEALDPSVSPEPRPLDACREVGRRLRLELGIPADQISETGAAVEEVQAELLEARSPVTGGHGS